MKILIVSSLFPPDVADPASYIKELSSRLSHNYEVTVLTYGSIPESVNNVKIIPVPKRLSAPLRLMLFTWKLLQETRKVDLVLVQNAPSTELSLVIVSLFYKSKLVLQYSDKKIMYTGWRKKLHQIASRRVIKNIDLEILPTKPEILPFTKHPTEAFIDYENAWTLHLISLEKTIT